MNASKIIKRVLCLALAAAMLFSAASCSKRKKTEPLVTTPQFGEFIEGGYELPYEFADGFKAVMQIPPHSQYETVDTTPSGSKNIHLNTTLTEDEVRKFYEIYFDNMEKVVPIAENDSSTGYYDKDIRLVLFNLNVWTADGKTNYKIGTMPCEDINANKVWKLAESKSTPDEKSGKKSSGK